mmetsp:Transcript_2255/g.4164  ORF Transcript_2255/g.4164 Transcript_2255/m.4164 type:complete len:146 (+) Transcript_2255:515-952(+)
MLLDTEGPAVFANLDHPVRFLTCRMALGDTVTAKSFIDAARVGCIEQACQTITARLKNTVTVAALACTSFSFSVGVGEVRRRLESAVPGCRAVDMASAIKTAIHAAHKARVSQPAASVQSTTLNTSKCESSPTNHNRLKPSCSLL